MGFQARIVLDSIASHGARITTMELTYPRMIHSEFMTHRDRARNAASSRAIPWPKMLKRINEEPVIPLAFGAEQKGMQTGDALVGEEAAKAEAIWLEARDHAVKYADQLHALGVHKSICNRITEPWMWITVVTTATAWNNLFRLRCHPDAEIHFQKIAGMARDALLASSPQPVPHGDYHLPYIRDEDREGRSTEELAKASTARCARVSYLTHDGACDVAKDLVLFDRLVQGSGFGHWCYDASTEVLTDQGWMCWAAATLSRPRLAAVNIDDRTIRFEEPSGWVAERHCGPMYAVRGPSLDLCVTPEHSMVVSRRRHDQTWSPYELTPAREIAGRALRYLRSGNLIDRDVVTNPFQAADDLFAGLVGFFVGDGGVENGSANVLYFNIRLPRKIAYLRTLWPAAELLTSGKWAVRAPGISHWFREHCYDTDGNKVLPAVFLRATGGQTAALLEGLRNSDGSEKRKTWYYDTTSETLAGQLQAILHLNGLSGNLSLRRRVSANHSQCYRIHVSERVAPRVEIGQTGRSSDVTENWLSYDDLVYCATVSTGALLVRRNGIVAVSGNSPHEHVAKPAGLAATRSGPFQGWLQYRKEFPNECASEDVLGVY